MSLKKPKYSELPRGYIFMDRYEVIKPLEKGSGGTVYLVKDTYCTATTAVKELENPEEIKEENLLKVLKVYEGLSEFNFFEREFITLSKISQKSLPNFPGLVQMIDA
jgi:hypothetical protein